MNKYFIYKSIIYLKYVFEKITKIRDYWMFLNVLRTWGAAEVNVNKKATDKVMTFTEAFHPPDNDDKGSACGVGLEGWLSEGGGKHAVVTVPFTTGFDFNVSMSTYDDIIV